MLDTYQTKAVRVEAAMPDREPYGIDVRLANVEITVAARTHVGRVREHNEDAFLVDLDLDLLAVADGMGGHVRGEVASREVMAALAAYLRNHRRAMTIETVEAALRDANDKIYATNCASGLPNGMGMGSTVVGLWFSDVGSAICFHVGDSRAYRLRQRGLEQLTRDHSLYQAWLEGGAEGIPPSNNILTRSLGSFAEVEPEVRTIDYLPGDLFLLCSDGLTGYWTQERLENALNHYQGDLQPLADELLQAAIERDGRDNITLILASVH